MKPALQHRLLILAFLALILSAPIVQVVYELRRGERPRMLELFGRAPSPANLRAFERGLEDASIAARTIRPWVQAVLFFVLHDGGEKVLVGRGGNLFYAPGVNAISQCPRRGESSTEEAALAVKDFRDSLAARGIRLIVVVAPNKESVYPQWLTGFAKPPTNVINPDTRNFMNRCAADGVDIVDLFDCYREISRYPYYLAQDTHWSPTGMAVAARAVASRIGERGDTRLNSIEVTMSAHGDLVRMMQSHVIESNLPPAEIIATQVSVPTNDAAASVLVLGDSFCRVLQNEAPGNAGFIAQLALELGEPVASIVMDGGGATLVRQELARRPQRLAGKRAVVWEFSERDLRLAQEGWPVVPLPPAPGSAPVAARPADP